MKYIFVLVALLSLSFTVSTQAFAQVEPDYEPSEPRTTWPWYGYVGQAQIEADMAFIKGMRPHHAGALTMSQDYLAHDGKKNGALQALANGIIHNQTFEIGMLDTVENHLSAITPIEGQVIKAQVATKGLAQEQRFMRMPMPGYVDADNVSAEDVRFAKAMIIHHEAALDMANDYLAKEAADNGYLRLMCVDIIRDQTLEIDLMHKIINAYQGDADAVHVDPSMVHGMDGMMHGDQPMHH